MADTDGKIAKALERIWREVFEPHFLRANRALLDVLRLRRPATPEEAARTVQAAAEALRSEGPSWMPGFVEAAVRSHFAGLLVGECQSGGGGPCSERWIADVIRREFPELEALLVRRLDWMNEERITDVWQLWRYEERPAVWWTRRQAQVAFEQMRRGLLRGDPYSVIIDAIAVELGVDRNHYTETVVRTNLASALGQGRVDAIASIALPGDVVVYQAIGDDRTRPEHLHLDGRVFEAGSRLHLQYAPPLGFNCRCTIRWYTASEAKRRGLDKRVERDFVRLPDGREYLGDPGFEHAKIPTWRAVPKRVRLPEEN